ncbi:MAG TPA: 3-oxoadipate enol-lactonase [Thermoleophilaceae bacterium]|nr:3-oxoadipate enol-lactonase [Thermoleophilaceae bacterium]
MSVGLDHRLGGPDGAPAVVLSNSLGASMEMWAPQLSALLVRYRVLRYDQRGHGGSPTPPGPYDIPDLAQDVLDLLDEHGIERAHFCGLSLGGMTGMWLGANAPERIDRLVLLCTSAYFGAPGVYAERAAAVRAEGTESVAEAGVQRWFSDGFRSREPGTVERFRAMIASQDDDGYAECCGALDRLDLRDELPRIVASTLVIAGAQDPATPPDPHARLLAERIPGARLEVLDPAAHLANVERADTVTELILEHLDSG